MSVVDLVGNRKEAGIQKSYNKFLEKWQETELLMHLQDLLLWDQRVCMPPGEVDVRAKQSALIADMRHARLCDNLLLDLVETASRFKNEFSDIMKRNIEEAKRQILYERALPAELVSALASETSLANNIWQEAKKNNTYKDFAPALKKVVKLTQEKAAAYQTAGFGSTPYEALFMEYEWGIPIAEVDRIFTLLSKALPPLVAHVTALPAPDDSCLKMRYPLDLQEKASREIITLMGFDWNRGRLDVSTHPFTCGPAFASVRITSRYTENDLVDSFFSAIHEAGHGLYEQNLSRAWVFQPIGHSCGLSIHESQSRFWECWIGGDQNFWEKAFMILGKVFGSTMSDTTFCPRDFYRAVNKAKAGFIRVDSDPLTYNLHILMRYEIEQMMISEKNVDSLVDDLPGIWNEKFKKHLGLTVPDDRRGILQDVHWGNGAIGYFPTYTLGNIFSAQLYARVKKEIAGFDNMLASGNWIPVTDWLREKVHRHGNFYRTQELVRMAVGEPLSVEVFLQELRLRYADVYQVKF